MYAQRTEEVRIWRQKALEEMIAGEDMLAARRLLEKGWQTVYAPEAEILYYRNDNLRELWKRSFDIGVAHAEHPEMIENTKPGKKECGWSV